MQPSRPELPSAPVAPLDPVSVIPSNAPVINTATPAEGTNVIPSYFSGNSASELVLDYEEIVYNDCDLYPQFVLGHTSPLARHLFEHGVDISTA